MPSETATAPTPQAQAFVDRFRAAADFRARVEADPQSAIAALGGEIPPHIDDVRIVEDAEDTRHFVSPPGPNGRLSDDELSGISGGTVLVDGWETDLPSWLLLRFFSGD